MLFQKYVKFVKIAALSLLAVVYSFALFKAGVYYGQSSNEQTYQNAQSTRFIVKEYDNSIAVFEYGSDTPQRILDIDISRLREYDRLRFKQGIVVESPGELAQLEEDFCS